MSKQRLCRICKLRPPWKYKKCPPGVCKACYHRHVWEERPAARKQWQAQAVTDTLNDLVTGDVLAFGGEPEMLDDLADDDDDDIVVQWFTGSEFPSSKPFLHTQRELHFHITLQKHDTQRHRDLIQNLQDLECTVSRVDEETIVGYLEYNPRSSSDRKAMARLHKLLNRWQRKGHLTWTDSQKT